VAWRKRSAIPAKLGLARAFAVVFDIARPLRGKVGGVAKNARAAIKKASP